MKNRKQMEARRRKKTEARRKRNKAYRPQDFSQQLLNGLPLAVADDSNDWFVLTGLNYLNSDYSTGMWQPLFNIYADDDEEDWPSLPDAFVKVKSLHYNDETQTWSEQGKLLAAWLLLDPEAMRGIRMALLRHLAAEANAEQAANDLFEPHHPAVWGFFYDQIVSRLANPEQGGSSLDDGDTSPVQVAP